MLKLSFYIGIVSVIVCAGFFQSWPQESGSKQDRRVEDYSGRKFVSPADFSGKEFGSTAKFNDARFFNVADFESAIFHNVDFTRTRFDTFANFLDAKSFGKADFTYTEFRAKLDLSHAEFHRSTQFRRTEFDTTDFAYAEFDTVKVLDANFSKTTRFVGTKFQKPALFYGSTFHGKTNFRANHFADRATFIGNEFKGVADFYNSSFDSTVSFRNTHFYDKVTFGFGKFRGRVEFHTTCFDTLADFNLRSFLGPVDFDSTIFKDQATFKYTKFDSSVRFKDAHFRNRADFSYTQFQDDVIFNSRISSKIGFQYAAFNGAVDFRHATLDEEGDLDFSSSFFVDTLFVGGNGIQRFDLRAIKLLPQGSFRVTLDSLRVSQLAQKEDTPRTKLGERVLAGPGAHILIAAPVKITLQHEKLSFCSIPNELDYFSKKSIIDGTKEASFKGDEFAKERFEMDFIFDKSVMYQAQSTIPEPAGFVQNCLSFLYYHTLGLGYRPFKILWWILVLILVFGILFMAWIPNEITDYLNKDDNPGGQTIRFYRNLPVRTPLSFTDKVINCLYFSVMLVFTVRLKKDLITFFKTEHKRIIVLEWFLGIAIYGSFLAFSKSGSILHNLKSLLLG